MTQFDLKASLKQISPSLRQELMSRWPSMREIDWTRAVKKRSVEPIFTGIQSLPADDRREVSMLLRTCGSLKSSCGLKVIQEELRDQAPDLVEEWTQIKGSMDKVIWTYLRAPHVFEEAIVFARADSLSMRRYWNKWTGVECGEFDSTDDRIDALKALLVEHHGDEGRGDVCEVHHYTRQNGAEYFFAYLPNWPEDFMIFNRSGELQSLDLPTAFSILFVFTPETGVLEMIAAGGTDTQLSLRRRFYQAMTRTEVSDVPPVRPAFELGHLLEDGFAFAGHDTTLIERIEVPRIAIVPTVATPDVDGFNLKFRAGTSWRRVIERLDGTLASMNLDRSQSAIDEIFIRIHCVADGRRRARRLTFRVTPRASDLKSIEDDSLRVLGEQCIRAWGIDRG